MKFDCRSCGNAIAIREALDEAEYSFPELNAVYYICGRCLSGLHLRFGKDSVQLIELVGAPGPHWKMLEAIHCSGTSVRSDPGVLHVWFDGNHYEAPAKGA